VEGVYGAEWYNNKETLTESATRKDVLMICETWKDAESLDAHEKAAHFITLVPKLQELGKMKLEKFEF
jgi:quinol monooxygenase YgiN